MKYAINIAREVGENTIKEIFVNSFDTIDEWYSGLVAFSTAFGVCHCLTDLTINEREGFRIAYLTFRSK